MTEEEMEIHVLSLVAGAMQFTYKNWNQFMADVYADEESLPPKESSDAAKELFKEAAMLPTLQYTMLTKKLGSSRSAMLAAMLLREAE